MSNNGTCKCADGKYIATLGGPKTQQKLFALADKMTTVFTFMQKYTCYDQNTGTLGLGEGMNFGRRRRKKASWFKRAALKAKEAVKRAALKAKKAALKAQKAALKAALKIALKTKKAALKAARSVGKAGTGIMEKTAGKAGNWIMKKAWEKIKRRVPNWAQPTVRKLLFERKFSGSLLFKAIKTQEFFQFYKKGLEKQIHENAGGEQEE